MRVMGRIKYFKVLLLCTPFLLFYVLILRSDTYESRDFYSELLDLHNVMVKEFYKKRENWNTSNLGAILYKGADSERFTKDGKNKYVVLIWKYWSWLKKRHSNKNGDPENVLDACSVKNCVFIEDDSKINIVDAVVIHSQRGKFPKTENRNKTSRWIFLNDESPMNAFSLAPKKKSVQFIDIPDFNWTMLYRSDSDVPVPYGRTVPLPKPLPVDLSETSSALKSLVPYWDQKTERKAMVLLSNCLKFRMEFIDALVNYGVNVDIYGGCALQPENKKKCPGHFHSDCVLPSKYMFYLVMENSKCREYITEKVFHHAFSKGAIPIIMGPSLEDCEKLLPPYSYIHVSSFESVKQLAEYLQEILTSDQIFLSFHSWRRHFVAANEHGYFRTQSYHLCRVCEALNYNDREPKVYTDRDLETYLDFSTLCDPQYGKSLSLKN